MSRNTRTRSSRFQVPSKRLLVPVIVGALTITIAVVSSVAVFTTRGKTESDGDGALPDGVTVFDDRYAGISELDPRLRTALREATESAAADGIEVQVNSGWRSAAHQARLFDEAIDEYGSREEAARWVATAETSAHVSGDAVDIAPFDAIDWLARKGSAYGLCQIYANESWHYELRPDAAEDGCPPTYPDPTHDPRLRQ